MPADGRGLISSRVILLIKCKKIVERQVVQAEHYSKGATTRQKAKREKRRVVKANSEGEDYASKGKNTEKPSRVSPS